MTGPGPIEVDITVLKLLEYTSGGFITQDKDSGVSWLKVGPVIYTAHPGEDRVSDR